MNARTAIKNLGPIAFLLLLFPLTVDATQQVEPAHSKSLLTLHWVDEQGNENSSHFNLDRLEALTQKNLTLELPKSLGIQGTHDWQGVSLGDVIKLSGTDIQTIHLKALNGYYVTLPISDVEKYNPLLAYRREGRVLTIRDKGPFILIYPFNKFKALNQQLYINRSIWQINEIHIE